MIDWTIASVISCAGGLGHSVTLKQRLNRTIVPLIASRMFHRLDNEIPSPANHMLLFYSPTFWFHTHSYRSLDSRSIIHIECMVKNRFALRY